MNVGYYSACVSVSDAGKIICMQHGMGISKVSMSFNDTAADVTLRKLTNRVCPMNDATFMSNQQILSSKRRENKTNHIEEKKTSSRSIDFHDMRGNDISKR